MLRFTSRAGHDGRRKFLLASVVDLKFLRLSWHSRLGTSNPKTTLDSKNYQCGFESEIRPARGPSTCEFRIRHTGVSCHIGNGGSVMRNRLELWLWGVVALIILAPMAPPASAQDARAL